MNNNQTTGRRNLTRMTTAEYEAHPGCYRSIWNTERTDWSHLPLYSKRSRVTRNRPEPLGLIGWVSFVGIADYAQSYMAATRRGACTIHRPQTCLQTAIALQVLSHACTKTQIDEVDRVQRYA